MDPQRGGGGHVCILIAQRWVGFDKTAREQCSRLYTFQVGPKDCEVLAEDWIDSTLLNAAKLPKFHYYRIDRMGKAVRGVVKI